MADLTKLKFSGGPELEKALEELGDHKAMRAAGLRALRKALRPVRDEARANIRKKTRLTEKDIKIRNEPDGITASVGLSNSKNGRAYIGRFLEFGTATMDAKPFLRPAIDENAQEVMNILSEELGKEIVKQAAKVAKYSIVTK